MLVKVDTGVKYASATTPLIQLWLYWYVYLFRVMSGMAIKDMLEKDQRSATPEFLCCRMVCLLTAMTLYVIIMNNDFMR